MPIVTGLFDTYDDARRAAQALESGSIDIADISIVSPDKTAETGKRAVGGAEAGAGIGAVAGIAGGALAGLSVVAIPMVAVGWLAAVLGGAAAGALVGGAAGGLIGALTEAGVSANDARFYAEAVVKGGSIVVVRVDESQVEIAAEILRDSHAIDPEIRWQILEEEERMRSRS